MKRANFLDFASGLYFTHAFRAKVCIRVTRENSSSTEVIGFPHYEVETAISEKKKIFGLFLISGFSKSNPE